MFTDTVYFLQRQWQTQIQMQKLNTETKKSNVYEDGLTLTEEEVLTKKRKGILTFRTDFAGTVIKGDMHAKAFTTQTLNKNWYTVRLLNRQRFQKLPHFTSYIHPRIKRAVIIGMMIRLDTQNTNEKLFKKRTKYHGTQKHSIHRTIHYQRFKYFTKTAIMEKQKQMDAKNDNHYLQTTSKQLRFSHMKLSHKPERGCESGHTTLI